MRALWVWIAVWVAGAGAARGQGEPVVVSMYPDHGDIDVDPATPEIWIEFDRDMRQSGHSLCGAGGTMPRISGKARWVDARTFAVPVELEAGVRYSFSVNCPSAQNFRGADGVAAARRVVSFQTLGAGEMPVLLTPEVNAEAVLRLRRAVTESYAHAQLSEVPVLKVVDGVEEKLVASVRRGEFMRELAGALGAFKDIHVSVVAGEMRLGTYSSSFRVNWDAGLVRAKVGELRRISSIAEVGTLADGTAYVAIRSWGPSDGKAAVEPIVEHVLGLGDAPGVIFDVRANGGGDEGLAEMVAECVTPDEVAYSTHRTRERGSEGGWSELRCRVVGPRGDGRLFPGRVAVLIGPGCCSSNESFVAMIMATYGHRSFGARTRGSSGNPRRHDLGNGVAVVLPSWEDYLVDGTPLEGRGIAPDVAVEWPERADRDVVLEAAAAWVSGRGE